MEHFRPQDRAVGAEKLPAGLSRLAQASTLINQIITELFVTSKTFLIEKLLKAPTQDNR